MKLIQLTCWHWIWFIAFVCLVIILFRYWCSSKFQITKVYEHEGYRIQVIDNVFSEKECEQIIQLGLPRLKPAQVMGKNNQKEIHHSRTNEIAFVSSDEHPVLSKFIRMASRLAKDHLGKTASVLSHEDPQILRYRIGEFYGAHFDHCDENTKVCQEDLQSRNGQKRVATVLIYLNNVEQGGETKFPAFPGSPAIKPVRGRCVVFSNLDTMDQTKTHPLSLHEAVAPVSGEKWAVNVWLRGK